MFCPNCGKELKIPNQRFCIYCGNELTIISKTSQSRTDHTQYYIAIPRTKPISADIQIPVSKKERTVLGPYSKKCLAFSIVSCAIAIFCVFSGGAILLFIIISRSALIGLIGFIVSILANTVGLIFGILSRVNNTKAGKSEPSNSVKKVGSIFGIHGIIFNSIELGIALIIMGIIIAFATL